MYPSSMMAGSGLGRFPCLCKLSDQRLTEVVKFVHSTSLDELPQFINVLKGDMVLIGPRLLCAYYLPLYSKKQHRRHDVRPGITGWAQVNGYSNVSWTKKFELDVVCSSLLFVAGHQDYLHDREESAFP